MNCKYRRHFTFTIFKRLKSLSLAEFWRPKFFSSCWNVTLTPPLCNTVVLQRKGIFVKKKSLYGKKLEKKGGSVVHVKGWHPDPRILLIKNSSCLFFKESSFNLAYKMYVCVCKGFGMTTHMVQQITWANNRVPLLCQHRSYSTTKCLWSSWYHLEMGGTTLLADKVGDNMTLTEFGRLLLAWQNEKWHFYTLVEKKHLTSSKAELL